MVSINIADKILITSIFIVIVYGGYYLATYLASNRIINERWSEGRKGGFDVEISFSYFDDINMKQLYFRYLNCYYW